MKRLKDQKVDKEDLFVGIDLHKNRWHVTIRTMDLELFSASIPGDWECTAFWPDMLAIVWRRSMKPDVLDSGFMTAWWIMASPVWLLLRVWSPRNTAIGSRPTGVTAGNWRICWPRGC
ncbi:MAG: hypothetical protein A2Y69_07390 [Candidatus Aminicenantes bacterium RBG_13_59_9]|nr:MAG: hypothetical protein A2Y69_07390 [Candidatus Aminicenantes bacterium RBG_13_59_9]